MVQVKLRSADRSDVVPPIASGESPGPDRPRTIA